MSLVPGRLLLWLPPAFGILVSLFMAMFALDSINEGGLAFVTHLVPALLLLSVVVLSWKRPWLGGAVFMLLALAYAISTLRRPDWIVTISGPLLIASLLYLWSWRRSREQRAR